MGEVVLELNDLQTHFFTDDEVIPAVDGISLKIHKSEVVGIVGEFWFWKEHNGPIDYTTSSKSYRKNCWWKNKF